jgi:glycine C-acetyltransferase
MTEPSTALERLADRLGDELARVRAEGRYYLPNIVSSAQGPRLTLDGISCVNLACNNYLGFAQDPQVVAGARAALERYGFGLGAGRVVCSMPLHDELERRLAEYKGRAAALVCQTGYDTNVATLATLTGEGDVILSDAANHASIVDGCRLARAETHIYPHADMDALEALLRAAQGARTVLIVTDGVFSMDGDLAPLPEIVTLAERYGALVYVDDAHGDGVLGRRGTGIVEHFDLHGHVAIEMGTLSKAFGGVGGFVATEQTLRDYLYQRSRTFMFSTGHLPPAIAAGLLVALDLLAAQPERLARLWENAAFLREGLQRLGYNTGKSVTPIIPVLVGEATQAMALGRALRAAGVYAQAFAYPVVPEGTARLRCIVSAAHSREDLEQALHAFESAGRTLHLIS